MLLQVSGRTNALGALLMAGQDGGLDYHHLAYGLSVLYPGQIGEKRLPDAMLLAVSR